MTYHNRPERAEDPDSSGQLFNELLGRLHLQSDKELAAWFESSPSYISKIRHGIYEVAPKLILHVHEKLGWSVKDIRFLISQSKPE